MKRISRTNNGDFIFLISFDGILVWRNNILKKYLSVRSDVQEYIVFLTFRNLRQCTPNFAKDYLRLPVVKQNFATELKT